MADEPEDYRDWRAGSFAPDGEEIWAAFQGRVGGVLHSAIAAEEETVLMVCTLASSAPPSISHWACRLPRYSGRTGQSDDPGTRQVRAAPGGVQCDDFRDT
jgi:hypothetical protein